MMSFFGSRIRYFVCFAVVIATIASFMSLSNINLAMGRMIKKPEVADNETTILLCPGNKKSYVATLNQTRLYNLGRFDWTPEEQGYALGSVYISTMIFQIPAGLVIGEFGGYLPLLGGTFLSAAVTLATPLITQYSVYGFISFRVLLGIAQAFLFPATFVILCSWFPVRDRATVLAIQHSGGKIGGGLFSFTSGYLMNAYSWKALFYLPGILLLPVLFICALLIRNKPEDLSWVTKRELEYINRDAKKDLKATDDKEGEKSKERRKSIQPVTRESVPWVAMLTNKAVLVWLLTRFVRQFFMSIFHMKFPFYMSRVLNIETIRVGHFDAYGLAIATLVDIPTAKLSEVMIEKNWCSRTTSRKIFSILPIAASGVFFGLIPAARCSQTGALILYLAAGACSGAVSAGDGPLAAEMSKKFLHILYVWGSIAAALPAFLAPAVAGIILESVDDQWLAWEILFYGCAAVAVLSNLLFLVYASAERQDFDYTDAEKSGQEKQLTQRTQELRQQDPASERASYEVIS